LSILTLLQVAFSKLGLDLTLLIFSSFLLVLVITADFLVLPPFLGPYGIDRFLMDVRCDSTSAIVCSYKIAVAFAL
jgi:hypothetical protein